MKKQVYVLVAAVLFAVVTGGWSWSKGYESQKSAGGLNITLTADRYPLVKADNTLSLKVTEPAGKAVTNATVEIRFFMPPMPGMAPMQDVIQPQQKGNEYSFTVNVAMEGGWKIEATVTQPGKDPAIVVFNVDAR
jgi:hypothetical protein